MRERLLFRRLRPLSTALAITCLGPCVLQAQDAADRPPLEPAAPRTGQRDHAGSGRPGFGRVGFRRPRGRSSAWAMPTSSCVVPCWPARGPRSSSAWEGFDQSVRRHPDWPYARFGLALTALEIYVRRYPLPADYDNVASGTHYDGYARQMERTLRAEPGFQPAIDWVVETMIDEATTSSQAPSSTRCDSSPIPPRCPSLASNWPWRAPTCWSVTRRNRCDGSAPTWARVAIRASPSWKRPGRSHGWDRSIRRR